MQIKKNIGSIDRIIRVVIAAILVVLYFTEVISGTIGIVLLVLAAVLLITSLTKVCLLYLPFGISTCKKE